MKVPRRNEMFVTFSVFSNRDLGLYTTHIHSNNISNNNNNNNSNSKVGDLSFSGVLFFFPLLLHFYRQTESECVYVS